MATHEAFLAKAIALATENVPDGGGPFGAVIVKDGRVLATGVNRVSRDCDPTAHAEILAIRAACQALSDFRLVGCTLYASCEPCPMCLSAIYWARLDAVYYANTQLDAAAIGFDDELIYRELSLPAVARTLKMTHVPMPEGLSSFAAWAAHKTRVSY